MRDYAVMRHVLTVAREARTDLYYSDFLLSVGNDDNILSQELVRLTNDGLLDADISLDGGFGSRKRCVVSGLTDEGQEFCKLLENHDVWAIILNTLKEANVDVSYPLLKEVCEEIVKRYVTSFIPQIQPPTNSLS